MTKNPLLANPELAKELDKKLRDYRVNGKALAGIPSAAEREALVAQMVDSVARIEFVKRIAERPISPKRLDPKEVKMFDPLRAAIQHMRDGNVDEAFWLVFLFVHCGKHATKGYGLLRMVYGAFQDKFVWTWQRFNQNPNFSVWLGQHIDAIKQQRREFPFGNHRKYESLDQLDAVLTSYVDWIASNNSHEQFIAAAKAQVGDDPKVLFDHLYKSMDAVQRFGRTAKFDFLTMVGKIGLVDIEPPSAYMVHATGPVRGARLLFTGTVDNNSISKRKLDELSFDLDNTLGVGMQVIEDSLCNWQKKPAEYLQFRG
ncbi:hypothetical protein DR64_2385 [Paraburkholderia xenovorans LB400]|uniref:Alpha-glutamyl/putrescinyl thymine pyrophosphorylase clade 3 domain-containing protein n=1 Tax=Paraburkholderia xenovorans (strain LB400) TaxID=266265 RepID=Q13T71_PARXL|nr:hypothetical protein [Paraburkholderia xenovorans]ABE32718.1 hypothetical protein Bxe_A0213 [Paraburkholderia xenovorans LB400]AIP30748.1 hypothetical protein DR64_2385 [Paraburkholderia xenovorans LB400]